MIGRIVKLVIAARMTVVVRYPDEYAEEKTGKILHEHAMDFFKTLWTRRSFWVSACLSGQESALKVNLSDISLGERVDRVFAILVPLFSARTIYLSDRMQDRVGRLLFQIFLLPFVAVGAVFPLAQMAVFQRTYRVCTGYRRCFS